MQSRLKPSNNNGNIEIRRAQAPEKARIAEQHELRERTIERSNASRLFKSRAWRVRELFKVDYEVWDCVRSGEKEIAFRLLGAVVPEQGTEEFFWLFQVLQDKTMEGRLPVSVPDQEIRLGSTSLRVTVSRSS